MTSKLVAALLAFLCGHLAPAFAADKEIGIVLLHGKWDRQPTKVEGLGRQLEAQGFQVATPTMPWSANREYDVSYPKALNEIAFAVKELRDKGAKHIVIGGLSIGGNAALAYAGSGKPVDALLDGLQQALDQGRWRADPHSEARRVDLLPQSAPLPWDELMHHPTYQQALERLP